MGTDGSSLRILLVDDSEDDVLVAKKAFAGQDGPHVLETVSTAEEALDYLKRRGRYADRKTGLPDILLLDINMPGMDGVDLLRNLKADPELRKIPVVMLTTSAAREDIARCYECGAASYITKPSSMSEFRKVAADFGRYWSSVSSLPGRYNRPG